MNPNLSTETSLDVSDLISSETRRPDNETTTLVNAAASTKTSCELFESGLGI